MSDTVLEAVTAEVQGVTLQQLRSGTLELSQPGNGGWHFYAQDRVSKRAAALASAWARAFANEVQKEVSSASSSGLEAFITASPSQTDDLAAHRVLGVSIYMLTGAAVLLTIGAIGILFLDMKR